MSVQCQVENTVQAGFAGTCRQASVRKATHRTPTRACQTRTANENNVHYLIGKLNRKSNSDKNPHRQSRSALHTCSNLHLNILHTPPPRPTCPPDPWQHRQNWVPDTGAPTPPPNCRLPHGAEISLKTGFMFVDNQPRWTGNANDSQCHFGI